MMIWSIKQLKYNRKNYIPNNKSSYFNDYDMINKIVDNTVGTKCFVMTSNAWM